MIDNLNKKNPKVSVLMPAYNAEKYIGEAIESILNQTFTDFEFIIVDDGSTDKTWEIIQEYVKKDERVISLRNKVNLHISKTRNRLITLARGQYVAWQDADDISKHYRLQEQVACLDMNSDVGIVGGFLKTFTDNGKIVIRTYSDDNDVLKRRIFRYVTVAQPTAMVRKAVYSQIGMYNEYFNVAEDLDLLFRIGSVSKFANIQKVVVEYRIFDRSITFKKVREMESLTLRIRQRYAKDYGYRMSFMDRVYNVIQFISMYIIPYKFKFWLFNKLRG